MVLAHSLRDNGTRKQLAVLVTLDSLSASTLEELKVHTQVTSMQISLLTVGERQHMTTSYPSTVSQTSPRKTSTS